MIEPPILKQNRGYHVGREEPRCWGRGSLRFQNSKSEACWSGDISGQTLSPSVYLGMKTLPVITSQRGRDDFKVVIYAMQLLHLVGLGLNAPSQPGWGWGFSKMRGLAAKGIPLKTSTERKRPRGIFSPWMPPPSVCTTPSWRRGQTSAYTFNDSVKQCCCMRFKSLIFGSIVTSDSEHCSIYYGSTAAFGS